MDSAMLMLVALIFSATATNAWLWLESRRLAGQIFDYIAELEEQIDAMDADLKRIAGRTVGGPTKLSGRNSNREKN